MKKLIFILTLFIYSNLYADFFIESTSTGIVKNEGYKLPNGDQFAILKGTYQWTNNLGYYGTAACKGLLEKGKDLSSINFLCESVNQKGDKQYSVFKRKSKDLQSGSGKYKNFKGIECKYAAKLFEINSIVNQKCMISNE